MKIALLGYGKMGREIEEIALGRGHQIVLKVTEENAQSVTDAQLKQADVAIEFSRPESAFSNIIRCIRLRIPVVSGTTGWIDKLDEAKKECLKNESAFFYASNYSIGVNVFFQLNRYLARIMNQYEAYNPSMKEIHHIHKKDSPSGTGLTLANDILAEITRKTKWVEGVGPGADSSLLQIESLREGEVPGTHTVSYSSGVDDITISHVAHNRKGFALGALLAAEYISSRKGVFGMNDLMGITN
jgi:4-hydroxy-tetrahydrodipicolinate reductase